MHLPVVDLSLLHREEGLQALDSACRDWGFFKLVGHDISSMVRDQMLASMKDFFLLPATEKLKIERTAENPWGFFDHELTKNVEDWKEIFDVGPAEGTRVPQWPEGNDEFRGATEAFYAAALRVSLDLVAGIAAALKTPPRQVVSCFDDHTSFLRLNYYPLCPTPAPAHAPTVPTEGRLGISHHSDAGAVTVLLQDGQSGLQVQRDGRWHLVESARGDLIVNIGDVVQVWSNDRYLAPQHRVLASSSDVRFSAPFFLNPSYDSSYAPLPGACGSGAPRYRPISWGEFRAGRAAGDFADYGAEIQIDDYRIPT